MYSPSLPSTYLVEIESDGLRLLEYPEGFFLGPTIFDGVAPEMKLSKDEIFGPVASTLETETLDEAIERAIEESARTAGILPGQLWRHRMELARLIINPRFAAGVDVRKTARDP